VDTKQWLQKAGAPLEYLTLGQKMTYLTSKSDGEIGARDLLLFYPPGGGGYGDPLDRDPQRVKEDVLNRAVSREWARKHYGVVLNENLEIDETQTHQERQRIIERRLREAKGTGPVRKQSGGKVVRVVGEYLELVEMAGGRVIRCRRCQHVYCPEGEDLRKYALTREQRLGDIGPWVCKRWNGNSPNFVFVEYFCPGCGVLFDTAEKLKSVV
jgi:N-methylhydantoinase B